MFHLKLEELKRNQDPTNTEIPTITEINSYTRPDDSKIYEAQQSGENVDRILNSLLKVPNFIPIILFFIEFPNASLESIDLVSVLNTISLSFLKTVMSIVFDEAVFIKVETSLMLKTLLSSIATITSFFWWNQPTEID